MRTITTYNSSYMETGVEVRSIQSTNPSQNLLVSSRTAKLSYGVDSFGRPLKWFYNGDENDYEIERHGCCGLEFSRDRSGATRSYAKDVLKRTYRVISQRSSNGPSVTSTTAYDGLEITRKRHSDAFAPVLISKSSGSLSGLRTDYEYPDADDDGTNETASRVTVHNSGSGSTTTNTSPDGSTTITVTFADGSTKSTKDQDNNQTTYDKGTHTLNGGGLYTLVTAPNGTQSTKSYRDQLGRTIRTEYADGNYSEMVYYGSSESIPAGARGKLNVSKDADQVSFENSNPATGAVSHGTLTSYGYNTEGERNSVTTQLPDDQQLVQTKDSDVVSDGTLGVCLRTRSYTNGVLVSTSLRSTDGYSSKTTTLAGTSSSSRTAPLITYYEQGDTIPQGKQVGDVKTIDGTDGKWEVTSIAADGTQRRQYYLDGLMVASVSFESGSTLPASAPADITNVTDTGFITGTSMEYDDFGRTTSVTNARTGTVTYNGYHDSGSLVSMTDATNNTTVYYYDKMGRTIQVNATDTDVINDSGNTVNCANITYTSYYPTGQVKATWGDQTYARLNIYDSLNRLKELRTYQNLAHGTEPTSSTPGFAKTGWIYDGQRGWLLEKNYDGETDDGATDPDYTYTAAGRLLTRTWERGITTTYSYENGMLASTVYSDTTTPGVTYAYDSFGRVVTVTQSNGTTENVHSYVYDTDTDGTDPDTNDMLLKQEIVSYANASHVRTIDRHYDSLYRPIGYELKSTTATETASSYGYDNAGRLHQVGASYPLPTSPEFTYSYLAESGGMVQGVTGPAHSVTNTYESARNILTQKLNKDKASTPATVSHFTYLVNEIGQRESQTTAGTAFSSSFVRSFGYDAKGQVVSDNHDTNNTFDRAYAFDGIGNRTSATEDTTTVNYTANSKNQYSAVGTTSQTYDADGNLTNDGTYKYIYDAENRLIKTTDQSDVTVTWYKYDYLSRRWTYDDGTISHRYVYDGWNPIAVYSNSLLLKTYTWGKDLSGSMQGAGGVGGLLAVKENSSGNSYYPTYNGNGNVSEYLDSSGAVVAHYEYDAFGKTVNDTTQNTKNFAHRFSTKQWDSEASLYYYGYRYYTPETGRWINRDPIEENGGLNLYGFVRNVALNYNDLLGLAPIGGGGNITVVYDPPNPREVVPQILDLGESGTNYYNRVVNCKCGKLEVVSERERSNGEIRQKKQCCITCHVSFEAVMKISREQAANLQTTIALIYGHEQWHIVDRNQLVEKKLVEPLKKERGCYRKENECADAAKKLSEDLTEKLITLTSPDPKHVRHDNDPNTAMPGNGEPIPPMKGTLPGIIEVIGQN
ncbi:RHS repeat-associated core domain-containing protein [Rubritalea halochordaticola]